MITKEQSTKLNQKLKQIHVSKRSNGRFELSYIESHQVIRAANDIFGFDGWKTKIESMAKVQQELKQDKHYTAFTATIILTVGETQRHAIGFGQGIDRDLGKSFESATKEAESDALKRAFRTFGDQFGLALYDKRQTHVEHEKHDYYVNLLETHIANDDAEKARTSLREALNAKILDRSDAIVDKVIQHFSKQKEEQPKEENNG